MSATVTFEETGETRKVRAACMAHHTRDFGETLCGRDATRDGWWWPL